MMQITIIGAGLAGLSAAVTLSRQNIPCNLISYMPSERSQSVLAEGGINGALDTMGEGDVPENHFQDTMKGGVWLADPEAVRGLTQNAPGIIKDLAGIGVPFNLENGKIALRNFGGQKKKRTAYARSSTGKILMSALIDEARKYEASGKIRRFSHHEFIRLLTEEKDGGTLCTGVRIRDRYTGEGMDFAGEVLLAYGGMNGFFPEMTTGTTLNSGDAAASVFAQGLLFANPEMIQYHPTTIGISGKRMLISEAARGEGGRLFVERKGSRWYFMEEKYPELGNLMPRDVVSREMYFVVRREDCGNQVYLDMDSVPEKAWSKKLSDLREELIHYQGMDPKKEPVPVEPGVHYFMGGILTDVHHRTSMKGVHAAGECACQYHGANRLGGNSMLGAVYGGRTAALDILKMMNEAGEEAAGSPQNGCFIPAPDMEKEIFAEEASPVMIRELSGVLLESLGIVRNEKKMQAALEKILEMKKESHNKRETDRLLLSEAMIRCALARKESRGAHYREDYPEKDDAFLKTSVAACDGAHVTEGFREIGS